LCGIEDELDLSDEAVDRKLEDRVENGDKGTVLGARDEDCAVTAGCEEGKNDESSSSESTNDDEDGAPVGWVL